MKKNKQQRNKQNDPGIYGSPGGRNWGWRVFIVFALLWIIITYFFRQVEIDTTELSYTQFKQNIYNQKIQEVIIKGKNVTGKFKTPYKKIIDSETKYYNSFITRFLSIEDPDLIKSLQENRVIIKAEPEDG
jgi:ATP-dependent Zn protease